MTHVCRPHWSRQIMMKIDEMELSANTVAFISCRGSDLSAPVMSTDMSQAGVTLFSSFNIIFIILPFQVFFLY